MAGERLGAGIDAGPPSREERDAERRGLGDRRPIDRRVENVAQELHRPIARRHAAVDANDGIESLARSREGVLAHRREQVAGLVADAFQRRARQFPPRGPARQADHDAARVAAPMGRAEPGEGGNEIDRLLRIGLGGEGAGFGRMGNDAEPVAQPLHRRAGGKNRPLQRIAAHAAPLIGDGGQQPWLERPASSPVFKRMKPPVP